MFRNSSERWSLAQKDRLKRFISHRVAGGCHQPQAPSEPRLKVSLHAAQASHKASPCWATRRSELYSNQLCDTSWQSQCLSAEGAPASLMAAVICFPSSMWFSQCSRNGTPARAPTIGTRRMSAPFRVGQSLNPYPPHYKVAFASSCISGPHLHQCALRFHLPDYIRRRYGVSTFRIIDPMSDLGAPWTPAVLQFRASTLEICNLTAYDSHKGDVFNLLNLSRLVRLDDACGHSNNFTISLVPSP